MSDARRASAVSVIAPPAGKHQMPALGEAPNTLEIETLGELDQDKLSELAECLFMLNGRRFGPIPGFYVVVALSKKRKWCVGQLSADRATPLRLFDDLVFASPEEAREHAEAMRSGDEEAATTLSRSGP